MNKKITLIAGAIALLINAVSFAGHHEKSVFHDAFHGNLDSANEKVISLAEAFSEEQYDWKPAEGIRSVQDSILHVAAANYGISQMLGATLPEGLNPWKLESTVDGKEDTLATLKASIEFAKEAVDGISEEELADVVEMFGKERSKMAAVLIIGAHANEHLGQLIAYARSTGVTPPWSK